MLQYQYQLSNTYHKNVHYYTGINRKLAKKSVISEFKKDCKALGIDPNLKIRVEELPAVEIENKYNNVEEGVSND